jgi:hypothetical protein
MAAGENRGKLYRPFTLAAENKRQAGQFFTGIGED